MGRPAKGTATPDAAFDALLEQATKVFPPATILGDGESFAGTFERMDSGPTNGYGDAPIVVYKDALTGEERAFWLLHTAAKTQVGRARPVKGEKFVCVKLGKRIAKKTNRPYEDYRFVVEGREVAKEAAAPTFDDLLKRDDETAETAEPVAAE